jgi:hypothetical protein
MWTHRARATTKEEEAEDVGEREEGPTAHVEREVRPGSINREFRKRERNHSRKSAAPPREGVPPRRMELSLETPLLPKKKTSQLVEHLEDPDFREVWIAFLKKTYCYENMMFYEAVEDYQSSTSAERVRLARLIYGNFIDEGAENQVNLSNQERRPLAETILRLAQATDVSPPCLTGRTTFTNLKPTSWP